MLIVLVIDLLTLFVASRAFSLLRQSGSGPPQSRDVFDTPGFAGEKGFGILPWLKSSHG
jgi:hypothetical protein